MQNNALQKKHNQTNIVAYCGFVGNYLNETYSSSSGACWGMRCGAASNSRITCLLSGSAFTFVRCWPNFSLVGGGTLALKAPPNRYCPKLTHLPQTRTGCGGEARATIFVTAMCKQMVSNHHF